MAECPGIWRLAETKDGGLARLRLPGGAITADQFDGVAEIARSLGNGLIDLTHRANLQIRGLAPHTSDTIAAALGTHGLMADTPDADRLRNILASPLAGLDPGEIIDVTETVHSLDRALQAASTIHGLSPKFSFVLDGGGCHDLSGFAHDIGLFAEQGSDGPLFRISLAGRLAPFTVAPSQAAAAVVALAKVAATADSQTPLRVSALLETFSTGEIIDLAENAQNARFDRMAIKTRRTVGSGNIVGALSEDDTGHIAFGLGVPLARLTDESAIAIASLSRSYGDGTLRLTPWQSIILPAVPMPALHEMVRNAENAGFFATQKHAAVRILACAGSTGCLRTGVDTKKDGLALLGAVENLALDPQDPLTIHLCGCNRGCAHPGQADLLFLGGTRQDRYQVYSQCSPGKAADMLPLAPPVEGSEVSAFVTRFLRDGR